MKDGQTQQSPVPDALIFWTTSAALIGLGIVFFDDAIAIGRAVLALGLLSAANAGLRLRAVSEGAQSRYRRLRLALAIAYVALVLLNVCLFSAIKWLPWPPLR